MLAGKRIAPQWVRRNIACERVEECMRECGREKRFMCEGFNYRLDPSGHGQGDCELIEVPLAQIDLYSSPNQRDSNMLRHPDYDYYERDRNAPSSCRKNICKDCSKDVLSSPALFIKPTSGGWNKQPYREDHYLPSPSSSDSRGSGYYPPSSTAVDHYRPTSYDHPRRPPPSGSSSYQSSSYEYSSHGSSYFEHTPPSSYGSTAIDRYDYSRPDEHRYRPSGWESMPSSSGYDIPKYRPRPPEPDRYHHEPPYYQPDYPSYRPSRPSATHDLTGPSAPTGPSHNYLDRGDPPPPPTSSKYKDKFVPYLIGNHESNSNWGSYGGSYGGSGYKQNSYWGLKGGDYHRRRDPQDFNYFNLGGSRRDHSHESNSVLTYPGSSYNSLPPDYRHQWTRRPGPDGEWYLVLF